MVIVSTALRRKKHRSQAGEGQMWMESEEVDSSRNLIEKESAVSTRSRICFLPLFFLPSPLSSLLPSFSFSSSFFFQFTFFFKVQGNIIFGLLWWLKISLSANVGDVGLIPGSGRSPREGSGSPSQYSCLGNPKNRGAWQATYSPWGCRRLSY